MMLLGTPLVMRSGMPLVRPLVMHLVMTLGEHCLAERAMGEDVKAVVFILICCVLFYFVFPNFQIGLLS